MSWGVWGVFNCHSKRERERASEREGGRERECVWLCARVREREGVRGGEREDRTFETETNTARVCACM